MKQKLLLTFALLLTAVTGAWADLGDQFVVNHVCYTITSESPYEVSVSGYEDGLSANLVIPASVVNIKLYAIYMCTGLASLDVCGAASIAKNAFFKLTGLRSVKFRASGCTIDSAAFNSCAALTDIYVPWSLGDVAGAPWGATNATIHYDTVFDSNGNVIS